VQPERRQGCYVYVLSSSGDDYFPEITAVSIASLRLLCPDARIAVISDRQTSAVNSPGLAAIRPVVDDFLVVDTPNQNPFVRSRFLKASIRSLVPGQLLYLDSDTVIMRSPAAIWRVDADVAAAPDLSTVGKPFPASDAQEGATPKLGWKLSQQPHLNAGVIYFADTKASCAVGEQFHKSWLEYCRVTGNHHDQLSFNHAIHAVEARLSILPSIYNAQISMNVLALRGAVIVHYFTSNLVNSQETIAHTLARRLKHDGILDTTILRTAIESRNPWTRIDSYRKAVAARRYFAIGRIAFDRLAKKLNTD
jgi:hypothetical protein